MGIILHAVSLSLQPQPHNTLLNFMTAFQENTIKDLTSHQGGGRGEIGGRKQRLVVIQSRQGSQPVYGYIILYILLYNVAGLHHFQLDPVNCLSRLKVDFFLF
jgi:hypothetical protein